MSCETAAKLIALAGGLFALAVILLVISIALDRVSYWKEQYRNEYDAAWLKEHRKADQYRQSSEEKDGIIYAQAIRIDLLHSFNLKSARNVGNLKWKLSEKQKELDNERSARGTGTDQDITMGELPDGAIPGTETSAPHSERGGRGTGLLRQN